ncbi:hypothetical protein BH11PLA2_BH11PLA2_32420 [soil metagenome]
MGRFHRRASRCVQRWFWGLKSDLFNEEDHEISAVGVIIKLLMIAGVLFWACVGSFDCSAKPP